MKKGKPWSGRFTEKTHEVVENFTASIAYDRRLYRHDIAGSVAHARMLARVDVLTEPELKAIVDGLTKIESEIDAGDFAWSTELEDVHMNIEARLIDRIGDAGKKLHTGRSRNDQVATDLRLYLRDGIDQITGAIVALQTTLLEIAEREADTILPGFTHMQVAQPVSFGHHMMAWLEQLERDKQRLSDCRRRVNVMPLGAAALAGTSFPIDRAYTAKLLGFEQVSENSLDAVSDRDFAIEFIAAAALLMMHLSRFSEELVLWSTSQFGFIDLPDAFCTGSSIMPQKKNPDVPELVRGKAGRVIGSLVALLILMKAQPLAYNRDNQEDKEPVFDALDTTFSCLVVFTELVAAMRTVPEAMNRAAGQGYSTATDLADYLVRKGVAFRDAHAMVGNIVQYAIGAGKELSQLPLEELQGFDKTIDDDVFEVLSLRGSVNARNHIGGTAPAQVRSAVKRARQRIAK